MSRKKKAAKAAKKAAEEKARLESEAFRKLKLIASATWESASTRREEALKAYAKFNDKAAKLLADLEDPGSVYSMNITDEAKAFLFREDVFDLRS